MDIIIDTITFLDMYRKYVFQYDYIVLSHYFN